MSYIANLVHRTLRVTPVAQPVMQAKFAPPSQTIAAAGQDFNASQTTAPVPWAAQSLSKIQAAETTLQSRMLDAQPEPANAREGQGILNTHSSEPAEPAAAHSASNERESVIQLARPPENPRLAPHAEPGFPVAAQTRDTPDWPLRATQTSDDFRLMKSAPSAQAASGFRPSSPSYSHSNFRSKATEPQERPVVQVHIGRVDVRMVTPGAREPRTAMPVVPEAKPASLDDYLRARQRGYR